LLLGTSLPLEEGREPWSEEEEDGGASAVLDGEDGRKWYYPEPLFIKELLF